jgi:hypothetical protein
MECKVCKIYKEETEFYNNRKICKSCVKDRVKAWKLKNPNNGKFSQKKRRLERHKELLVKEAVYREEHRDEINKASTKYRKLNRDKCKERSLKCYYDNKWKYKKYREEHREKHREYCEKYRKKNIEKIRKKRAEQERRYRKEKPLETKARKIIYYAIKRGKINKPTECQICNMTKALEAHHKDYNKPLDVIWVCKKCHGGIHLTLNRNNL